MSKQSVPSPKGISGSNPNRSLKLAAVSQKAVATGKQPGTKHTKHGNWHRGRRWAWLSQAGAGAPLSSAWVSWAQSCLARVVGPWVPQDGIMGPQTLQGIQMFQTQQQLPATGMLDSGTISALQTACSAPSAAPPPPPAGPPPPPAGPPAVGAAPPAAAPAAEPAGASEELGQGEYWGEQESLREMEELAQAAELSAITNEQELDQFLGDLINDIGRSVKGFANSAAGQAVGGILKSAAKQVLPLGGAALGGLVGGPAGAMIGSQLASGAGQIFGLELGEMSPVDHRFETNKRFLRFARNAVKRTTEANPDLPPIEQAKSAVVEAAKQDAPGLVAAAQGIATGSGDSSGVQRQRGLSGHWRRQGKDIVLYGV